MLITAMMLRRKNVPSQLDEANRFCKHGTDPEGFQSKYINEKIGNYVAFYRYHFSHSQCHLMVLRLSMFEEAFFLSFCILLK